MAFRRVGITVKTDLTGEDAFLKKIIAALKKAKVEICVDRERMTKVPAAKGLPCFDCLEDMDLLLVIGGDGTILRAVRELKNFSVPILSINRGNIGFLAEMSADESEKLLASFLKGEGEIDHRSIIGIQAKRGKQVLADGFVLNEAVISQGSIARLIDLDTDVNGRPLTTFRADGLIIATPTGSTAYTLAAGGPIVHPHLSAAILTPINAHSFSQKPIVIPGTHTVDVTVRSKVTKFGDTEVSLTLDGQTYIRLKGGDVISAAVSEKTVKFLRRKRETFYETLREKLKWGESPQD